MIPRSENPQPRKKKLKFIPKFFKDNFKKIDIFSFDSQLAVILAQKLSKKLQEYSFNSKCIKHDDTFLGDVFKLYMAYRIKVESKQTKIFIKTAMEWQNLFENVFPDRDKFILIIQSGSFFLELFFPYIETDGEYRELINRQIRRRVVSKPDYLFYVETNLDKLTSKRKKYSSERRAVETYRSKGMQYKNDNLKKNFQEYAEKYKVKNSFLYVDKEEDYDRIVEEMVKILVTNLEDMDKYGIPKEQDGVSGGTDCSSTG